MRVRVTIRAFGPPQAGKTTVLTDIAKLLSDKYEIEFDADSTRHELKVKGKAK